MAHLPLNPYAKASPPKIRHNFFPIPESDGPKWNPEEKVAIIEVRRAVNAWYYSQE
jgi:hypothetical protein